jgi:Arc/MetJ family transcription regulator
MLMRTTLDLNEKLIRELMEATSAKTKTEAIHRAAAELIRRKKLDQLKALSGKIRLDLDWKKLEQAEIRHQASLKRRRHGHR